MKGEGVKSSGFFGYARYAIFFWRWGERGPVRRDTFWGKQQIQENLRVPAWVQTLHMPCQWLFDN